MGFTKIPKDTLAYWGIRILLVLIPAAAAAIGAIRVASIEANTARVQAEAGYKTSVERIEALEKQVDQLQDKVIFLEGELSMHAKTEASLAPTPGSIEMTIKAGLKKPTPRAPMPRNLEGALQMQMKK